MSPSASARLSVIRFGAPPSAADPNEVDPNEVDSSAADPSEVDSDVFFSWASVVSRYLCSLELETKAMFGTVGRTARIYKTTS